MGQYLQIILMLAVFVIFWLVLILPEKKRKKKYQEMLQELKVNDEITTVGGVIGRIIALNDEEVVV